MRLCENRYLDYLFSFPCQGGKHGTTRKIHKTHKWCPKCKSWKLFKYFGKRNKNYTRGNGFDCYCKECWVIYRKEHPRTFTKEEKRFVKAIIRAANWNQNHPLKHKKYSYNYKLKTAYGLTRDQYNQMHKNQKGKCAVESCSRSIAVVDHNHFTNKVRALVCFRCNTLLGLANDNIKILKGAIQYLKENN